MSEPWDGDLTGAVIDNRFVVGSLLGSGGMAEVYRAYDRATTSSVAIKVFTGPGLPDDELRLEREATMLASLECPGLIPVYASGSVSRRPYFVMREITGGTLRQRMREPLPPRFVARIGGQIAAVLDHVHGLGVVHRDIKPSNILLDDEEKQAYLADFGLALVPEVTRVTTSGVLVGTAGYLAPEQVRGSDVGPEADVYSLGLVLLECLTGRSEYPGGDAEAALARLARPPRIPIDLPLAWVSLLSAMTDMEPARRPTAAQCSRSLSAAYEASRGLPALLPDAAVSPDPAEVPRPRKGKRLAITGAAAVAVAAVAVAVANLGGGGGEAPAADEHPLPGPSTRVITVGPSTVTVVQTPDVPGAPQRGSSSAGSTSPSSTPTSANPPTSSNTPGSSGSSPTQEPPKDPVQPTKDREPGKPTKKSDTPRP
ncbi:serine/threonine-protein kinase [Lentzea nigeriaca]|uniref:serine/threonine-protein kinase n=1 Tax=Lentzea nigeriaca TaxID=1128665 RepID=UPI00195D1C01|nr:serine/threonine-protein kinase [Lentzea nigeriaca]MBM7863539.1 serine/threonine protein kinase [Lentzea nigeriaca]